MQRLDARISASNPAMPQCDAPSCDTSCFPCPPDSLTHSSSHLPPAAQSTAPLTKQDDSGIHPTTPPRWTKPQVAHAHLSGQELVPPPHPVGVSIGRKAPKSKALTDGIPLRARPTPDSPSPPRGMIKRDATLFIKSYLQNSDLQHVGPAGISYMAGMLAHYEESGWQRVMDGWGKQTIEKHESTGKWHN